MSVPVRFGERFGDGRGETLSESGGPVGRIALPISFDDRFRFGYFAGRRPPGRVAVLEQISDRSHQPLGQGCRAQFPIPNFDPQLFESDVLRFGQLSLDGTQHPVGHRKQQPVTEIERITRLRGVGRSRWRSLSICWFPQPIFRGVMWGRRRWRSYLFNLAKAGKQVIDLVGWRRDSCRRLGFGDRGCLGEFERLPCRRRGSRQR